MEHYHYGPLAGWSELERLSCKQHGPRSTNRLGFHRWGS